MTETAGYPNKAFVTPDRMATGLTDLPEIGPNQGPGSNPTNRPMRILLA